MITKHDNVISKTIFFIGVLFIVFGLIALTAVIFFSGYINASLKFDTEIGNKLSSIMSGIVGTLFSVSGAFIIIASFISQNSQTKKEHIESIFFKFIDMHYSNIDQIKIVNFDQRKHGINEEKRSAFVSMKLQLYELLKCVKTVIKELDLNIKDDGIIDTAYMIFYYGINSEWKDFMNDKIPYVEKKKEFIDRMLEMKKIYEDTGKHIGNTNQTFLSSYMRNLYNAIKYIDESGELSLHEKKEFVKVLRAQLSNPELYILYFNVRSRFGKKWLDNKYVLTYQLFTNIPSGYCQEYNHKEYFKYPDYLYEDDDWTKIQESPNKRKWNLRASPSGRSARRGVK